MKNFRSLGMFAQAAILPLEHARDEFKRQLAELPPDMAAEGCAFGDQLREAIKRAEDAIAQYRGMK